MSDMSRKPPTDAPPPQRDALALVRFLGRLVALQRRAAERGGEQPTPQSAGNAWQITSLRLAEALLRGDIARQEHPERPAQVAVLGPTQTGKSTVVNLLLGRNMAEVSPLAGYTVHAQGFWMTRETHPPGWLERLFPGFRQRDAHEFARDELDVYALTVVSPPAAGSLFEDDAAALPPAVVWDTPDFDSLSANQYQPSVLEVAALADVYVLVLSKEKYADLTVWRMLELLSPLRRPLVICINKMTADSVAAVTESLRRRLHERVPGAPEARLVQLPHDERVARGHWTELSDAARQVRAAVRAALSDAAAQPGTGSRAFLSMHWETWLEPVRAEHRTILAWQQLVAAATEEFLEAYRRDYLDHPERYDSFRRAAMELLKLLELPVIGNAVARVRQVVTWPARKLLSAGQHWWRRQRAAGATVHHLGPEAGVLSDALVSLLTSLERDVSRRCGPEQPGAAVWSALAGRLSAERPRLLGAFEAMIQAHHQEVQRDVRAAANELYQVLREHPARLNTLRGARATIDAGYLLLAVKTGGLTPVDAVWAPASFALTSLLMEGATEIEMSRVARRLKDRQWNALREGIVARRLVPDLNGLAHELDGPGLLGISPPELREAETAWRRWSSDDA